MARRAKRHMTPMRECEIGDITVDYVQNTSRRLHELTAMLRHSTARRDLLNLINDMREKLAKASRLLAETIPPEDR